MSIRRGKIGLTRHVTGVSIAALTAATGLLPTIGWAQESSAQAAASVDAETGDTQGGEILVTARRRAENPQDVPIALSVFGGEELEKQNIFTIEQLQRAAPSLQIIGTNPRNTNINIRGLGANIGLQNDGLENGVGVYLDDVYYARTGQATFDLVDIDRIELLRGPQGTLFGKNTTAGALSIYTRQPSFEPEFRGDASIGSRENYQVRGSVSTPLNDRVAIRLSAAQTSHGGYLHNTTLGKDINDYNNFSVKGQVLAKLTDDLTLRLIGDYGRQHEAGYATVNTDIATQRTTPAGVTSTIPNGIAVRAARAGYVLPPIEPYSRTIDTDLEPSIRMKQGGGSGKLDWALPSFTITSITAWRFWDWKPRNDADGTALPVLTAAYIESKQRQFTQEIRLGSAGKNTIDYVVGAFYFHQSLDSDALTSYGSSAPIWLLGADTPVNQVALNGFAVAGKSRLRVDSYAGFGQATWNIDDRLSLTLGGRYTKEKKIGSFVQTTSGADLSGLSAADQGAAKGVRGAFGAPNAYDAETSESKFSGQANLAFRFSNAILGYATVSRGFKSGGLTLTNVPANVPKVIAPESIDHYEVGLKTQTADKLLTLNVAGFWTIDKNYQSTIYDPIRTTTYVSNVGRVRSRGVEIEGGLNPIEGLTTYGAFTYLDAKYLSFKASTCPIEILAPSCDLSNRRLPGAPKWSAAFGGEYSHSAGGNVETYAGLDYSYRSGIFFASNLSKFSTIPGYSLVNARIGARIGTRYDLSIWARNLFDKNYLVSRQPAAFNTGLVSGLVGDPRVIGATVRVRL